MLQYNSFFDLRKRLCNSACLINTTFGYATKDSLLPLPNLTNGSVVLSDNKVYGLCSSSNLVVQNISEKYIPTKKIKINKKYLNSEIGIDTRNNENLLISHTSNNNHVSAILGTKKVFIYDRFMNLVKEIKVNNALAIDSFEEYMYVVAKDGIYWINTHDLGNITYGLISNFMNKNIIKAQMFKLNGYLHIALLSRHKISIVRTPVLEVHRDSNNREISSYNFCTINKVLEIDLQDNYREYKVLEFNSVLFCRENARIYSNNYYKDDICSLVLTTDKYTVFYTYDGKIAKMDVKV